MIIHKFDPVLVDLGFLQIKWYSLAYIVGILLGWMYIIKIIKNQKYNPAKITNFEIDEIIIYLIIGIILGGRLGYAIFYNLGYFSQNLLDIFKLWHGGMSFHGGLIGIIVSVFIYSKTKKINFLNFTDLISCAAPIGIFFGRIANFINGELYGKFSLMPWAVVFPNSGNFSRHPSQIYEAILEGAVLFLLINYFALRKQLLLKAGYVSALFLILYSIFRIFSEYFREPDTHIGYLFNYFSMGTLLSIVTFFVGCVIVFFIKKNEKNI